MLHIYDALGTGCADCLKPYRIMAIYWLMAQMPSSTFLLRPSLYWQTCHLLLRFICLHEVAISALLCCGFSGPIFRLFFSLSFFICTSATAIVERCFPRGGVHGFSSLPCSRFNRERRHGKRVNFMFGLSHTCDAMRFTALLNVYSVQVLSFPIMLRKRPMPLVNLLPGVRMLSSRRLRVSRQASPFLA